jgi:hypothetical protein
LVESFIASAESFTLPRQNGQPQHLIFSVEAAGMVPLVEEIAGRYGITVISGGGFDSTTSKYALAQTLSELGTAEVLHIGDYDPSGEHVFSSIGEDVCAFARGLGALELPLFTRLAVTPEQITSLTLPTAPPKLTDRRSFSGTATTQVEAIPPDELVRIITDAITSRTSQAALEAVIAEEERIKTELRRTLIPALRGE